jgi:hypothetical protein
MIFYDSFEFVIKIFVIEVDISSSDSFHVTMMKVVIIFYVRLVNNVSCVVDQRGST